MSATYQQQFINENLNICGYFSRSQATCKVCFDAGNYQNCMGHTTRGAYIPQMELQVLQQGWMLSKPLGRITTCPTLQGMVCQNPNCFNGNQGVIRFPMYGHTSSHCPCVTQGVTFSAPPAYPCFPPPAYPSSSMVEEKTEEPVPNHLKEDEEEEVSISSIEVCEGEDESFMELMDEICQDMEEIEEYLEQAEKEKQETKKVSKFRSDWGDWEMEEDEKEEQLLKEKEDIIENEEVDAKEKVEEKNDNRICVGIVTQQKTEQKKEDNKYQKMKEETQEEWLERMGEMMGKIPCLCKTYQLYQVCNHEQKHGKGACMFLHIPKEKPQKRNKKKQKRTRKPPQKPHVQPFKASYNKFSILE